MAASTPCSKRSGTMSTTPSTTTCKRGEVYLVVIKFSDGTGMKPRPAVVVSVDAVHRARRDALVVPLTTDTLTTRFGDHVLRDWAAAGLLHPSLAKGVVETVDR